MYRQFCKNYKNFIKLNKAGLEKNKYRLKIAESIKGLVDLETYKNMISGRPFFRSQFPLHPRGNVDT
jgi:hypothetical protein